MAEIYIPEHKDLVLPSISGVRVGSSGEPDAADCRAWDAAHWAPLEQNAAAFFAGRVRIHDPNAVGAGSMMPTYPTYAFNGLAGQRPTAAGMGNVQAPAIPGGCPVPARDGGTPNPPCEPVRHCGVTPLPFNTFGNANFPLAGVVVGTYAESAVLPITSGRSPAYQANWIFLSARDQGAGFAFAGMGALTQAQVNGNSQFTGDSLSNRPMSADMFAQIGPLPLDDWRPWTNIAPQVLQLTFGNPQGAAVLVQFAGAFWGESLPNTPA